MKVKAWIVPADWRIWYAEKLRPKHLPPSVYWLHFGPLVMRVQR